MIANLLFWDVIYTGMISGLVISMVAGLASYMVHLAIKTINIIGGG